MPAYRSRALGGVPAGWGGVNGLTARLNFSHNLARVFPPALYAAHPEFFPLVGGSRLKPTTDPVNWNPDLGRVDVAEWAAQAARDHFVKHPRAESFALGINDGLVFGESAELLAVLGAERRWFRGRPDFSPLVFTFMNRVGAEVARPDRYVGALAYYWAENAPPFPVDPHVIPFLTADRSQGYDPAARAEEVDLQERWIAALQAGARTAPAGEPVPPIRAGLYDYLEGAGFLVPRIHLRLLAENLREARALGFTDYYAEGLGNWGLDGPQPWVVAQLLQDPAQPIEPLLVEYYRRFFGPAAGPMRRFFERCEEQWMQQGGAAFWLKYYRDEAQAQLFPSGICRELRGYLEEAARLAPPGGRHGQRVIFVSDAFRATEAFVRMCEARNSLVRAVLMDPEAIDPIRERRDEFSARRREFLATVGELQRRQPLALARVNLADWDSHDPLVGARLALGELPPPESGGRELVRDGDLRGPLRAPRTIAGLEYGFAAPAEWASRAEPAQFLRTEFRLDGAEARHVLRVGGAKDASLLQWSPPRASSFHLAQVQMRGQVNAAAVATLTFGWMDANLRNLGFTTARLPAGDWPEFVTLSAGGEPPPGAAWVGIGVRIQHQAPGDWIEVRSFSLKAMTAAE